MSSGPKLQSVRCHREIFSGETLALVQWYAEIIWLPGRPTSFLQERDDGFRVLWLQCNCILRMHGFRYVQTAYQLIVIVVTLLSPENKGIHEKRMFIFFISSLFSFFSSRGVPSHFQCTVLFNLPPVESELCLKEHPVICISLTVDSSRQSTIDDEV